MSKLPIFILLLFAAIAQARQVAPLQALADLPNVRDFTRFGNEAYATAQSVGGEVSAIVQLQWENGQWEALAIAPFSGKYHDLEPAFAPDGLRIYFASNRPLQEGEKAKDYDIWYVERDTIGAPWSEAKNVGEPVNTPNNEFYPAVTHNQTIYFTSDADASRKDDIYVSSWQNGAYQKPEALNDSINTEGYEFNAYIAPNESYIIFSGYNRPDGKGSGDLYISWNHPLEGWTAAENLGGINSDKMDYCPWVYEDTLYFTSKRSNIGIFNDVEGLKQAFSQYENGQSRLYKAPLPMPDLARFSLMERRNAASIAYYMNVSDGDTIRYGAFKKDYYGGEAHRWLMYTMQGQSMRGSLHIISKKAADARKPLFEDKAENIRLDDTYILQRSLFDVRFQEIRLTYSNGKKLTFYLKFIE